MARREALLLAVVLAGFAALAALLCVPEEEDAFIYYRYAWNWAHGHGLVFNPGSEPVEGFSSPLWMALLAALAGLGLDLTRAAPGLGLLAGTATLAATHRLAFRAGIGPFGRLATVLGLAVSYPFLLWAQGGLETPFYSLALVVAVVFYLGTEYGPVTDRRRRSRQWLGGLLLVPVALSRPEGVLILPLVAADRLTDRRDLAGAGRYLLPAGAGYGAYLVYRFLHFGSLTPNTGVKLYPLLVERSLGQIAGYVLFYGLPPLALAAAALLARGRDREARRRLAFLLAVVLVLSVFFTLLAGGDYRPGFRFLVPTLPHLLTAGWLGVELLARRRSVRMALLGVFLAVPAVLLARQARDFALQCGPAPAYWGGTTSQWIEENVPEGSVVAYGQMGRVPYDLAVRGHEVTFIDTLGLVDRQVAAIYRLDRKLAALGRDLLAGKPPGAALEEGRRERARRFASSLLARRPDVIFLETYLDSYGMFEALRADPGLARYGEAASPADGLRIYVLPAVSP